MSLTRTPTERERELAWWIARQGAAGTAAIAHRFGVAPATAERRLSAARAAGLLERAQPLTGLPAVHCATAFGLRVSGQRRLGRCRVGPANAAHLAACARVAAALELRHLDHEVMTERELLAAERGRRQRAAQDGDGRWPALASAPVVHPGAVGELATHRPDLVLWPRDGAAALAVEVELTAKAPARLAAICRGWGRCAAVAGVVYYVGPSARRAVERAVAALGAGEWMLVVPLDALDGPDAPDVPDAPDARDARDGPAAGPARDSFPGAA